MKRRQLRAAAGIACALLIAGMLFVVKDAAGTLRRLDRIEAERDRWQRPDEVIHALALREGSVVVDLGSGAGYFAIKMSQAVGKRGTVVAVDIRKLSLSFLWIRAVLRGQHNIHIIMGEEDDPRLTPQAEDAVLIANSYHEFRDPAGMLAQTFRALRPEGRLVIVDRSPRTTAARSHEIPLALVEEQVRAAGFQIVNRDESFIHQPGDDNHDEVWWLLAARKQ